jgi:hypothetical protein
MDEILGASRRGFDQLGRANQGDVHGGRRGRRKDWDQVGLDQRLEFGDDILNRIEYY